MQTLRALPCKQKKANEGLGIDSPFVKSKKSKLQERKILPGQAYLGLRGEQPGVDRLAQERQESAENRKGALVGILSVKACHKF